MLTEYTALNVQDLSSAAPQLTTNDWLIMGSTFHGLHSIAAQVRSCVSRLSATVLGNLVMNSL